MRADHQPAPSALCACSARFRQPRLKNDRSGSIATRVHKRICLSQRQLSPDGFNVRRRFYVSLQSRDQLFSLSLSLSTAQSRRLDERKCPAVCVIADSSTSRLFPLSLSLSGQHYRSRPLTDKLFGQLDGDAADERDHLTERTRPAAN